MSRGQTTSVTPVRSLRATGLDRGTLLRLYRFMLMARALDEVEVKLRRQNQTFFEISSAGHEGIQAAAVSFLRPGRDWFYPYYRDRTLCLGLGVTPVEILLQAMGKDNDPSSGGREMPAHYGSVPINIVNQSSPTGTQYLQAVGTAEAGLIARSVEASAAGGLQGNSIRGDLLRGDLPRGELPEQRGKLPPYEMDELVYVSGGEGSASEGEFFEAMSLASLRKLPVLFMIEDNGYAISVPVEAQTAGGSISAVCRGFANLHVEEVDGTDFVQSHLALRRAVLHVRSGKGPALVHARVVRLWAHSDSDDDRAYKTQAEKLSDQSRDPLRLFGSLLIEEGVVGREEAESIATGVRAEVARSVEEASRAPDPDPATAARYVFSPRVEVHVEAEAAGTGPPITMVEAINRTLETEMRRDPRIVCFGEDVADLTRSKYLDLLPGKGGVFKVTHNLQRKFGDHRVFNTPIGEAGIVGRAIGLAVRGMVPVAEIQFFDYIWPAMQQIRNELAMMRWRSNNTFSLSVVLRVPVGGYLTGGGPYHSQSGESIFCHCPGLLVAMPSNARDAAGILRASLRCEDPVMFLEHKHLYRRGHAKAPDPGPDHIVPLGRSRTVRHGPDLTIVTYGAMVEKSLRACDELLAEGIDIEVIDLRWLQPYDWEAIRSSVSRTSRALVVYEDSRTHGFGAEIAARIADELFADLDAPVGRVAAIDAPVAYSPILEQAALPQVKDIVEAARRIRRF